MIRVNGTPLLDAEGNLHPRFLHRGERRSYYEIHPERLAQQSEPAAPPEPSPWALDIIEATLRAAALATTRLKPGSSGPTVWTQRPPLPTTTQHRGHGSEGGGRDRVSAVAALPTRPHARSRQPR